MTRVAVAPSAPCLSNTAPASGHDASWSQWWLGLRAAAKNTVRYRYSVDKARRLLTYIHTTSTWRHLAVVILYPLPGLITSLIPTFVPLQDPTRGALHNPGFLFHGVLTTLATFGGGMLQARAVTSISHRDITTLEVLAIAVVGVVLYWIVLGSLALFWRFPVPFSMVVGAAPYTLALVGAVTLVLGRRMPRSDPVRTRLRMYLPSHSMQVVQILFYPAYSTLFEAASQHQQVVLIALFPVIKYYIKRAVSIFSYHLGDFHREVGVAGVEICASVYQATIMQNTPTIVSGLLIVLIDMLQGFIDVRRFLSTDPAAFSRALAVLQDNSRHFPDTSLAKCASTRVDLWTSLWVQMRRAWSSSRHGARIEVTSGSIVPNGPVVKPKCVQADNTEMRDVTQTLEVLQSMETILLVEYIETIAPVVNTVYLLVAAQLPSARFNPRVRDFYGDATALQTALGSLLVYSLLQAVTLGVLCLLVRRRFHVSALGLLAFVLEFHVWSLQGKMLAWFTFMFAFSVVHYGVDFSFQFDFKSPPLR